MTERKGGATDAFQAQVLRAMPLPPAWATAKQIYRAMDTGSYTYIKIALHELVKGGKLCKFGPTDEPAFRRVDLPEFKLDKEARGMVRQYQRDLAEYKAK